MKINLRVIRERISINVRYITLFTLIIAFSLSLGIFLSWILIYFMDLTCNYPYSQCY